MSEIAIKAEGLGKSYRIGALQNRKTDIRDVITSAVISPFKKIGSILKGNPEGVGGWDETMWALRDISFEINRGDVVGIIGRNGAGKSTLLKVLARITDPTEGYAEIHGRIGSLLEVGTGFHKELTGRENIFLSGSILGMQRKEIQSSFDEIVSFAQVEKFVDTPVKHYSSGMYLRLAFSVAAHLEPDILLIDEVLAVGDLQFQKKCLGKMEDVARQGRTVLFVSHNLGSVQELCERGILLHHGQLKMVDTVHSCVAAYVESLQEDELPLQSNHKALQLGHVTVANSQEEGLFLDEPIEICLKLRANGVENPRIFIIVENFNGVQVLHEIVTSEALGVKTLDGDYQIKVSWPPLWLTPGVYSVYFKMMAHGARDRQNRAFSEKAVLQILGRESHNVKAMLQPKTLWELE